jgi:chromosomal replication initiation ATPase DnaA
MTTEEYKEKVINDMIEKFKRELEEKTGVKAVFNVQQAKKEKLLTMDHIMKIVDRFIPPEVKYVSETVNCGSRKLEFIRLRFIAFHIARVAGFTLTVTGKHFDRDHTTVLNGLEKFKNYYETDDTFKALYDEIINEIVKDIKNGDKLLQSLTEVRTNPEPTLSVVLL